MGRHWHLRIANNADAAAHMLRARALATFEPVLCEIVFTHEIRPMTRDLDASVR
jgi:hypothetical protein